MYVCMYVAGADTYMFVCMYVCMQIHDEVILEGPDESREEALAEVSRRMYVCM